MDFEEVVRRRRMVRAYTDDPVPRSLVDRVLDAGISAPSAGFTQGVELVALLEPADIERFWSRVTPDPVAEGGRWARLRRAPVVIVPLSQRDAYLARYAEPDKARLGLHDPSAWTVPYWDVDAAFAVMAMLLAATNVGLGALFFAIGIGEEGVRADLALPAAYHPIGAIALGWPAVDGPASPSLKRGRRARSARVHYRRWGGG